MTSVPPVGLPSLPLARSGIDRATHRRTDDLLPRLLADPATRVLAVSAGRATPALAAVDRAGADEVRLRLRPPEPADEHRLAVFLGTDDDGTEHVAVGVEDQTPGEQPPGDWAGLRELGALLGARDVGLLTQAVALLAWHGAHTHCPRCGAPTRVVLAGHARHCDADGSDHYPRTDPAVIMTVVDADDRLLLGHQASWAPGRFSALAGFVEPGEPLEAAVRREVLEECGISVDEVVYLASQPWPFPASIMLGFRAHASSREIRVDGVEIDQARWFTRAQLQAAVRSRAVLLPPPVSIARALIEHWYGGPLGDGDGSWR